MFSGEVKGRTEFDAVADVLHLEDVGSQAAVVVVDELRARRALLLDRPHAPLVLLEVPANHKTKVILI